jgi:hypothetical protein
MLMRRYCEMASQLREQGMQGVAVNNMSRGLAVAALTRRHKRS